MPHKINPFWFIPMLADEAPPTLTLADWGVSPPRPDLLTGRITLTVRALTPVHVCGAIETTGQGRDLRPARRRLYRRQRGGVDLPVIDGSTLRGCVRSYVEALTNSVAAVYNVGFERSGTHAQTGQPVKKYQKIKGIHKIQEGRHIGFWIGHPPSPNASHDISAEFRAIENQDNPQWARHRYGDRHGPVVVNNPPHAFKPESLGLRANDDLSGVRVDPATLLFGLVTTEARERSDGKFQPAHALGGRVTFEDAWFRTTDVSTETSLEVAGNASFGAPNIRKSNWWYFYPQEVRRRAVRLPDGGRRPDTAEFVGGDLRGRKSYFHQDPKKCIDWYKKNWVLPESSQLPLHDVATECVKAGATSQSLRVHFRDLPEPLLRLLIAGLSPTRGVRHKLGALRAFGFGSVHLEIATVEVEASGIDSLDLSVERWIRRPDLEHAARGEAPDGSMLRRKDVAEATLSFGEQRLVSPAAWQRLCLVQGFPDDLDNWPIFAYPPYRQERKGGPKLEPLIKGFAHPLGADAVLGHGVNVRVASDQRVESDVLRSAAPNKVTIELDAYQLKGEGIIQVYNRAHVPLT